MAQYQIRLIPLTPIHVGAGETIALENYFLANGRLTRFHPTAVLRAMSGADRNRYLALLSGGDTQMGEALELLRQCAQKTPASWIYSIEVGPASRQSLQDALDRLDTRRGEVHPLIWNEITRDVVLPGSAIKGAIRTAVLSALVSRRVGKDTAWANRWESLVETEANPRKMALLAQDLERDLLRGGRELQWDPFRFVKVSDTSVPPVRVRLDRAALRNANGKEAAAGIQMHFERILSRSDGVENFCLDLSLTVEKEEKAWHTGAAPYLRMVPTLDWLLQSLNAHYVNRVLAEARRFPHLYPQSLWPAWLKQAQQANFALIRIGRFSHFESLSVEHLRRTQDRRGRWIPEGSSRTVCTPDGTREMPFGWTLLQVV